MRILKHLSAALLEGALVAALIVAALAGTTLAGKGGKAGGGGGGHHTSGTSSLAWVMVTDADGNGALTWGDTITFQVTTTATDSPYVDLTCSQDGTVVYSASAGFYDSFPWPGARNMPLESPAWTGGAASCKAVTDTLCPMTAEA